MPVSAVSVHVESNGATGTVGGNGATETALQRTVRVVLVSDFANARNLAEIAQPLAERCEIAPLPGPIQCQTCSGALE